LTGQVVLSGLPVVVNTADTKDEWTVEARPDVSITSIVINPDTASTGQNSLIAQVAIANLDTSGLLTAGATITAVDLNFLISGGNADTNFVITRLPNPTIPFNLAAGADIISTFTIDVDPTALDSLYNVDGAVTYNDINDGTVYNILSAGLNSDSLLVQTGADLTVTEFTIDRDTVSLGQEDVIATAVLNNSGTAALTVNSATLTFSVSDGLFERFLQNQTTPFKLPGLANDTLEFNITIADAAFLDNTDITVTASVSGEDDNSGVVTSDNAIAALHLQSAADPRWAGRTIPAVTDVGDTIQFRVSVINDGTARIDLDSTQTVFILTDVDTISLSSLSPQTVTGNGDTTELIFNEVIIPNVDPDDYAVQVILSGISNSSVYSETISAGQVTVGGDIFFAGGSVDPDDILRGESDVLVNILVGNSGGSSLTIDSLVTTILFIHRSSGDTLIPPEEPPLRRIDGIDTLRANQISRLEYEFDIPTDFPETRLGIIDIIARISLDNGTLVRTSLPLATFTVFSSADISFISPISTGQVVPRQTLSINVNLNNAGTSGLTLIPDSTYLEVDFPAQQRGFLNGNFIIPPDTSGMLDFLPFTIPTATPTDTSFSVFLRLYGIQVNGDTLIDTLSLDQLDVLIPAMLTINDIQISEDRVRWGQTDINIDYTVQNQGESEALFRNLVPHFWRDLTEVTSDWALSTLTPNLPDTLLAGQSRVYNASYVLTTPAISGTVFSRPDLQYSDLRTLAFTDLNNTTPNFDSVEVVQPAIVRVDSLTMIAPNTPRVNENQPFTLRFVVSNSGEDTVQSLYLSLLEDSTVVANFVRNSLAPNSVLSFDTTWSIAAAAEYTYRFRIDSAFDVTTASLVTIGESVDPAEQIVVQTQADLTLVSAIVSPIGAIDGTVSVGQPFTLRTTVSNTGSAQYGPGTLRLIVPANYQIVDGNSDRIFNPVSPAATWVVRATVVTTGAPDTLTLSFADSSEDVNTLNAAAVSSFDQQVAVVTEPVGSAGIAMSITAPAGAIDATVSTQQSFTVEAAINFQNSIADTGRSAELIISSGFSVATTSVKVLPDGINSTTANWQVIAPDSATVGSQDITVRVTARDGNSGQVFNSISPALLVTVQERAQVTLSSIEIIAPEGAQDGSVAAGQQFTLEAAIDKVGGAAITPGDSGQVFLDLPTSLTLAGVEPATKNYRPGDRIRWAIDVGLSSGNVVNDDVRRILSAMSQGKGTANMTPDQRGALDNFFAQVKNNSAAQSDDSLRVILLSTPDDVNTNQDAATLVDSLSLDITIEDQGKIDLFAGPNNPTVVSTSQSFDFTVSIDSVNVTDAVAVIDLPAGFTTSDLILPLDSVLTWRVTAPDIATNQVDTIRVNAIGSDINSNGDVLAALSPQTISVVPHLAVQLDTAIISPITANAGFVSVGQEIVIQTRALKDSAGLPNMADADPLFAGGQIEIELPTGFTLVGNLLTARSFASLGEIVEWTILAPPYAVDARTIRFTISQLPRDENSGQEAFVNGNQGTKSIAISARKEKILVTNLSDSLLTESSFRRGTAQKPILAFSIENLAQNTSLAFIAVNLPIELEVAALENMLSSIEVVNVGEFQNRQLTKPPAVLADFAVTSTITNPVLVDLADDINLPGTDYSIQPLATDTFLVYVSFNPGATNRSFRLRLADLRAYDVNKDVPIDVIDTRGQPLTDSELNTSRALTVIPDDVEEAFRNYPNPFGRDYDETTIVFWLDQDSDVEIRIFTLTGGLVKTYILGNTARGLHDGDVIWDGRNDRGVRVLNGVYICQIQIKSSAGNNTFITKIAYIK
jgi:hypothetical protein